MAFGSARGRYTTLNNSNLSAVLNCMDDIEHADHWPVANGEQVEDPNGYPSYISELMAVINTASDEITSANIDKLAEADPLTVQLIMQKVKASAAAVIDVLEYDKND